MKERSEALRKGYDQTAPFYDMQYKDFQVPKYQEAVRLLPCKITDLDRVLDHGCGTGLFFEYLKSADILPGNMTGLDYSPEMLKVAGDRGMSVVEGSIESLPFEDETFDALFSFTVLRIIPQDEEKILSEMTRVLRPNAYCVITMLIDIHEEVFSYQLNQHGLTVLEFEYVGQDMLFVCRKERE